MSIGATLGMAGKEGANYSSDNSASHSYSENSCWFFGGKRKPTACGKSAYTVYNIYLYFCRLSVYFLANENKKDTFVNTDAEPYFEATNHSHSQQFPHSLHQSVSHSHVLNGCPFLAFLYHKIGYTKSR